MKREMKAWGRGGEDKRSEEAVNVMNRNDDVDVTVKLMKAANKNDNKDDSAGVHLRKQGIEQSSAEAAKTAAVQSLSQQKEASQSLALPDGGKSHNTVGGKGNGKDSLEKQGNESDEHRKARPGAITDIIQVALTRKKGRKAVEF
ncbi:unnamed protein product [Amoebophrya sp. A25]|nr:unnamed protein product [Amoebophrya sp. A25]|eukprot:GSA25T00011881001.1